MSQDSGLHSSHASPLSFYGPSSIWAPQPEDFRHRSSATVSLSSVAADRSWFGSLQADVTVIEVKKKDLTVPASIPDPIGSPPKPKAAPIPPPPTPFTPEQEKIDRLWFDSLLADATVVEAKKKELPVSASLRDPIGFIPKPKAAPVPPPPTPTRLTPEQEEILSVLTRPLFPPIWEQLIWKDQVKLLQIARQNAVTAHCSGCPTLLEGLLATVMRTEDRYNAAFENYEPEDVKMELRRGRESTVRKAYKIAAMPCNQC